MSLTGVHSFTFLGQAGSDTMTVQAGNGAPLLAGLIRFDGWAGSNTLNVNAGGKFAVQSGPGIMVVVGGQKVTYARARVQVQNAAGGPRARRAAVGDWIFASAEREGDPGR